MIETSVHLPRHAFSVRDAARAGDLWRAFQELAVEASTHAGWPPSRYREENAAFVVRSMLVVHHDEARYGEPLVGRTWVSRMRREMFSTRELRITSPRGVLASARQEWVHVSGSLEPTRGSAALLAAFPAETGPDGDVEPALPPIGAPEAPHAPHVFELEAFWTWMDPLDHANHPAYLDWCDEATSRALAAAGVPPIRLVPVAEEVTFKSGVVAGDRVRVETTVRGQTSGAVVLSHRIFAGTQLSATATTVRRILGETDPNVLARAVRGG